MLRGTSTKLRQHTSEFVTCIRRGHKINQFPPLSHTDISWFVSSPWSQLQSLELRLHPASVPQLSNGAWPLLTRLSLDYPHITGDSPIEPDKSIFDGFKGKWPLLNTLIITLGKLDTAHIAALTEVQWTSLKSLKLEPLQDSALSALMHGNWPQLTDLSVGSGLSEEGLQPLSACQWTTLQRLELVRCKVDARGVACLVQARLPKLKELSFCQVSLTRSEGCFSGLAQGRWPLLAALKLELFDDRSNGKGYGAVPVGMSWLHGVGFDSWSSDDVKALFSRNWQNLQSLILDNFPFMYDNIPDLTQAAWPEMTLLTILGCFYTSTVISSCMQRWPRLESLIIGSTRECCQDLRAFAMREHPALNCDVYDIIC